MKNKEEYGGLCLREFNGNKVTITLYSDVHELINKQMSIELKKSIKKSINEEIIKKLIELK